MSIILKALKKAESASGKQGTSPLRASVTTEKRMLPTVLVALCTVALGFFLAVYLFRGTEPTVKPATQVMPKTAGPAAVSIVGSSTLNTDAVVHIKAGRHAEAESLLVNAVKKYPTDPYLHNHLGLALKKQGKLTEGALQYEKAMELKPDYFIAMNNLAVALEALGQKERAKKLYEASIEGDPTISGAHLNYALLREAEGNVSEAESQYHTFLTLSKDENLRGLVRRRLLALR
jgi:tetratricopeptide (TPR) repeat protein